MFHHVHDLNQIRNIKFLHMGIILKKKKPHENSSPKKYIYEKK